MHLLTLPKNPKELLDFLRNQKNITTHELLSLYTQALTLLDEDVHSLFIFLDYINLALSCSEIDEVKTETLKEIDHLYNLFKVKLRKFKIFWINSLKFQVEMRQKDFKSTFAKIVEYLNLKTFEGKEEILKSLIEEKEVLERQMKKGRYEITTDDQLILTGDLLSSDILIETEQENIGNIEKESKNVDLKVETTSLNTKNLLSTPSCIKTWSETQTKEIDIIRDIDKDNINDSFNFKNDIKDNTHDKINIINFKDDITYKSNENINIINFKDDINYKNHDIKDNSSNKIDLNYKTNENIINVNDNVPKDDKSVMFELELTRTQDSSKLRFSPKKHVPIRRESEKKKFVDIFSISNERPVENTKIANFSTIKFKDMDFFLINKIGKGGYSSVYKVCYKGEIYALKQIRIEDNESLNICLDEIDLLKKLGNYEFVIKMIDYEIKDEIVNILLEYGETDLQDLIKTGSLNIFYIKYLWESILKILIFVHSNMIVHRDIKPANFVLVKGKLKIIDFGISKSIKGDTTSILNYEKAGTLNYISPEQCSGKKISRATDVWAAGCILYYMVYRKNIHNSKTVMDVLRMMAEETPIDYGIADLNAIESMKACLIYDSKKRAKPEELLKYKFLQK